MGRVVITGVAGFLGSHLADKFLEEGWDVVGIDNLIGGYLENVPDHVEYHNLDLTDPHILKTGIFDGADLVVHAAALAYEGLSVFSPSLIVDNIVSGTTNVVTAAINGGAKRFIYLSSMARYGDHGKVTFMESFETRPQDPYGIAKVSAETLVQNLCDVHGLDWTIIVPHNIIGPRQKYDDPFRNVASIFTNRMLLGKQPVIYGDGKQRRSFSFVNDVVEPLYRATQIPEAIGQVINVGPDNESTTIIELAEIVAELLGFDLDPIFMPGRPQEVKIALCSAHKAREILGYDAKTSTRDGLKDLTDWIKEKGPKEFDYHLPIEITSEKVPETWSRKLM